MAYEILKSIVDAEAQAVEKKRQAAAQAEELKVKAQAEAAALLEKTRKDGLLMVDETVKNAVEDSEMTIQGIRREAQEACQETENAGCGKERGSNTGGHRKGCGYLWQ